MTKDLAIAVSRALGIWLISMFALRTVNSLVWLSRHTWRPPDSPELRAVTWTSALVPCCLYGLLAVVVLVRKKAFVPPSVRSAPLNREVSAAYLNASLLGVGILQLYAAYHAVLPNIATKKLPDAFEARIELSNLYLVSAVAFFIVVLWPRNSASKLLVGRDV